MSSFPRLPALSFAACLAACLISSAASARELASAPEVRIIGFSADGRHFAYEQFESDDVSDSAISAIDVVERDSGASAKGFPFGFLGISSGNGEFPTRVGGHKISVNEDQLMTARLKTLREAVARGSRARLSALGISVQGRRLAGFSITDRSPGAGAPEFVLSPTLPGPVPDQQPVYRATASFTPSDTEACISDQKIQSHTIQLKIEELNPDKKVTGTTEATVPWPAAGEVCASSIRITDIVAAPVQGENAPQYVAVVMLAISWGGHAEASRYFARIVKLP